MPLHLQVALHCAAHNKYMRMPDRHALAAWWHRQGFCLARDIRRSQGHQLSSQRLGPRGRGLVGVPAACPAPKSCLCSESTVRRWMPGPAEWLGLGEIPASSGALGCSSATAHSVSRLQLQLRRCCGPAPPWRSGNSPGLEARMSLSEHV